MSLSDHLETIPRAAAEGRPGTYVHPGILLSKVMNPITVAFGRKTVLVVRGRKSGKSVNVPMDPPFVWRGTRWLAPAFFVLLTAWVAARAWRKRALASSAGALGDDDDDE